MEDSLQILQYKKQLNLDLVGDISGADKPYTDEIIDSVLRESRMGYGGGNVHYAPDSAFKIYIIDGSGGRPYDNSMYHSFLHFKNGKRIDVGDDLDPITGVYKTGPFTYIAIQHYFSRSNAVHTEYYALTQFSVIKDSIQYISLECTDKRPLYYPGNNFTIYTHHLYENAGKTYMSFDPKTKKMSYRFMVGREQANEQKEELSSLFKNDNQVLQVTGTCMVKNGLLQFAGETFKILAWKEPNE
jgi:hypothetical protein